MAPPLTPSPPRPAATPEGERTPPTAPPGRLGDLLLSRGVITPDQLDTALLEQRQTNLPLGQVLLSMGLIQSARLRDILGETMRLESLDLGRVTPTMEALALLDEAFARRYKVLPLSWNEREQALIVAMSDAQNALAVDRIRARLPRGSQVREVLSGEAELADAIDRFYGHALTLEGILRELETGEVDAVSLDPDAGFSHPMTRLVNAVLSEAVKRRASDIHFSPDRTALVIRYRIDGVLRTIHTLHRKYHAALVTRLKVMGGMNITESRIPQDGRATLVINGHEVDFRIASHPTRHGENLSLRLLDRERMLIPLERMEVHPRTMTTLKLMLSRPEGLILVTGPTGSGKTTTLYAMMGLLDTQGANVMTLEDPIEYPMPGFLQTGINLAVGLDYPTGIRSLLRQDPDVILLGEIRDEQTAEMALRAAMTGHQVFSTIHANNALGALPRLLEMGVRRDLLVGNITGVLAQRLLRRLCPHCRRACYPTALEKQLLGLPENDRATYIFRPAGCSHCEGIGFSGRFAVMEALRVTPAFDRLVSRGAILEEFELLARQGGFRTLREDAVRRVLSGDTSLSEAV
ncbi:MAG: GspE/PulE family protein, partial [Magnetococcus sp. WYHC-3]